MKAGDVAPNFLLKDHAGKEYELYKRLDKHILLVFYPKDDTPICSKQLADYNDNLNDFINEGIQVVGISTNSVQSHFEFCSKLELRFPLLADENKEVSRKYNALNILGMSKRLLVLVGNDKKILWSGSTLPITFIKTEEILQKVKSLQSKEMT